MRGKEKGMEEEGRMDGNEELRGEGRGIRTERRRKGNEE